MKMTIADVEQVARLARLELHKAAFFRMGFQIARGHGLAEAVPANRTRRAIRSHVRPPVITSRTDWQ